MAFADDEDALDKYLMHSVNGSVGKTDIIVCFPRYSVQTHAVAYPKDRV